LALFITGIIGYKIYNMLKKINYPSWINPLFLIFFLIAICGYELIPFLNIQKQFIFYLFTIICIPFIFNWSKNKKWDNALGALSYPIYISHIFVINFIIPKTIEKFGIIDFYGIFALQIVLVFSILLHWSIEKPLQNLKKYIKN